IQAALRVIRSGEIGAVRAALVNFLGVVDSPGSVAYQADWRKDPALSGGGVLMDMLHGVYVAEALLGEPLQRVSAYVDVLDPRAGLEGAPADGALGLSQAIFDSFGHLVADFAEAVLAGRPPIATGADGQRILEATLAAYASGSSGEIVCVPLDPRGPVFQDGV